MPSTQIIVDQSTTVRSEKAMQGVIAKNLITVQNQSKPFLSCRATRHLWRFRIPEDRSCHPEQPAEGEHIGTVDDLDFTSINRAPEKSSPTRPATSGHRFYSSSVWAYGMFSSTLSGRAYMGAWPIMATRTAPAGSRVRMLRRCCIMAGLISTLLGGGSAQVTTSSLAAVTTATTPTVNRLTASTTYTPTNTWTPAPSCSAGSTAVGGYGGGVYLDGYGTYWSVACGYDFDGQTFYDGTGYAYVS